MISFNKKPNKSGYFLTIILAMGLIILPLPDVLSRLNPDWVLLALIYWTLAMPEKIGVFNACVVGLLVDVLTGRLLGQHALIYALVGYTCLTLHKRLRQYPILQQALFIFICLLFSQLLVFWIENMQSSTEFSLAFGLPVLIGTLFWPLIYSLLQLTRMFRV